MPVWTRRPSARPTTRASFTHLTLFHTPLPVAQRMPSPCPVAAVPRQGLTMVPKQNSNRTPGVRATVALLYPEPLYNPRLASAVLLRIDERLSRRRSPRRLGGHEPAAESRLPHGQSALAARVMHVCVRPPPLLNWLVPQDPRHAEFRQSRAEGLALPLLGLLPASADNPSHPYFRDPSPRGQAPTLAKAWVQLLA